MEVLMDVLINIGIAWGVLAVLTVGAWIMTPYESALNPTHKPSKENMRILVVILALVAFLIAGVVAWQTVIA